MPVFFNRAGGRYRPGGPAPIIRGGTLPPGVNVQMLGLTTIRARLDALPPLIQSKVHNFAIWKASEPVYEEVKKLAPFRSGRLRKSIKRQRRRRLKVVESVDVGSTAPYWHIVEFGGAPAEVKDAKVLSNIRQQGLSDAIINQRTGKIGTFGVRRKGIKAQPFIRPAFETSHLDAQKAYRRESEKKMLREMKALEKIQLD